MNRWNRSVCAAALLWGSAVYPALSQDATRILPERKPLVPDRPASRGPQLPGPVAAPGKATILPERKPSPEARQNSSAARNAPAQPTPVKEVKLGSRSEPLSLSARDRDLFAQALKAATSQRWSTAFDAVKRTGNPLLRDIVEWIAMRTPGARLDFGERTAFIEAHPQWPAIAELNRITESNAEDTGGPEERLRWFAKNPPLSTSGKAAYADAALSVGDLPLAEKIARETWITGRFDSSDERDFLSKFGRFLTPADHRARLEEMLYAEQRQPAERMFSRVDTGMEATAKIRLALIAGTGNVDAMIDRLPDQQASDPGLIYDRIKWRREHNMEDQARALLPNAVDTAPRPDLWWRERQILARDSLEHGDARQAYTIITNHGALDPVSVSEAEWLAGWVALRFLNDGNTALQHFEKVYDTVQLAANLSRAAYWVGRSAEALGRPDIAADWYRKAALHITTFYGQLAVGRLNDPVLPQLPQDPIPTQDERKAFENKDLTKAVRAIADAPGAPYLRSFALAAAESSDFAVDRHMAAELVHKLGHPELAVWIARQAGRDKIIIMSYGFPIPAFGYPSAPEKALMLAIMRQESNFDPSVASPAGALGLMQLMPATAKSVARRQKLRYNKNKLTSDPAYNVRLGAAYLRDLVDEFDGSYIMTAAAYNAGPSRPKLWARLYGDPRAPGVDAVDWVESIPFPETRNYVQRVMENVMVYRALLGGSLNVPQDLERELKAPRATAIGE